MTVGARVRIQTGCYITAHSTIEDDVFVAPGVTLTNDNTMGRHGPDYEIRGATLRRACRVGGGAVLVRGSTWARRRSWPRARWWWATSPRVPW